MHVCDTLKSSTCWDVMGSVCECASVLLMCLCVCVCVGVCVCVCVSVCVCECVLVRYSDNGLVEGFSLNCISSGCEICGLDLLVQMIYYILYLML